jgi:hypothetical protein
VFIVNTLANAGVHGNKIQTVNVESIVVFAKKIVAENAVRD